MAEKELVQIAGRWFPKRCPPYLGPLNKAERYTQLAACLKISLELCSSMDQTTYVTILHALANSLNAREEARSVSESLQGSLFSPTTLAPP